MNYSVFISCAKGMEYLLQAELITLGFAVERVSPQGVYGTVSLEMLYCVCLWSRIASRVHLILFEGSARDAEELYATCRAFAWDTVFTVDKSMAVLFHGESPEFRNSLFGAQVIKDAVVDFFRDKTATRPSVQRNNPEILLHAYLQDTLITLSLDMTGYSLHHRGYRLQAGAAPLKEAVAAAMLMRMRWPELAPQQWTLHDPFCGSGTLVIEAAMMAAHIAPGLLRDDQAFVHWNGHCVKTWEQLRAAARAERRVPEQRLSGSDNDPTVVAVARANALRAGVEAWIDWQVAPVDAMVPNAPHGLLVTNPPYGVRLGEEAEWLPVYQTLGAVLHARYSGWQVGVLTPSVTLARAIGLRSHKQYALYNGAVACKLYCISLETTNQLRSTPDVTFGDDARMFANRLKKNHAYLQKWAKRNHVTCYRVYDADLPDYAFAIDVYGDYVVLQEYMPPAFIDAEKALQRRLAAMQLVPEALQLPAHHVVLKERKPQRGSQQYQKLNQIQHTLTVTEGSARFNVNLTDYLDTGLFLDHRPLRHKFAQVAAGTRFLNCFCYTGTASVHAALAGARTVNVDLSRTYLTWAETNFKLNDLDLSQHQFVQYDCLDWLQVTRDQFDVIFLDPPSFSNSKRMESTFDVQRDHEQLIAAARRLLTSNGVLYFSTNLRQFVLAETLQADSGIVEITSKTIDIDFKRNPRIHRCFLIQAN